MRTIDIIASLGLRTSIIKTSRFAERCSYATDKCRVGKISPQYVDNRQYRCIVDRDTLKEWYANEAAE